MALKITCKLIQSWHHVRGIKLARHPFNRYHATTDRSTHSTKFNQLNGTINKNNLLLRSIGYGPSRSFKTSQPKQIPAIIWVVLRPLGQLLAVLTGRRIRIWWRNLPPNKRAYFAEQIRRNYHKIVLVFSGFLAMIWTYYYLHLETTPITNRRRFVAFSPEEYNKIADFEFRAQLELYQSKLLPPTHPLCRRVERVATRLLDANRDLEQIYGKEWSVTVVDVPSIKNAFVLPNGQIFVFTGMLKLCNNDDQLGVVLAHEMSHAILHHGAELLSFANLLDLSVILIVALIWAIVPFDAFAAFTHFLFKKIMDITVNLPYSRQLETEADYVGLLLSAKACFDVRECVAFWQKMSFVTKLETGIDDDFFKSIEFLSSHPTHDSRANYIEKIIPEALKVRGECRCPSLPRVDPRLVLEKEIKAMQRQVEAEKMKNVILIKVPPKPPFGA